MPSGVWVAPVVLVGPLELNLKRQARSAVLKSEEQSLEVVMGSVLRHGGHC